MSTENGRPGSDVHDLDFFGILILYLQILATLKLTLLKFTCYIFFIKLKDKNVHDLFVYESSSWPTSTINQL